MKVILSTYLDEEDKQYFDILAKERGFSTASLARSLLLDFIKEHTYNEDKKETEEPVLFNHINRALDADEQF